MKSSKDTLLTGEMLIQYYELNKKKREIEMEMNQLKDTFIDYFNNQVGPNDKGEVTISGYKLQRQIRNTQKYNEELTVSKLEELKMNDLIQVVKKPDDVKIKSALNLGFLKADDLEGCLITTSTQAITVKPVTPR